MFAHDRLELPANLLPDDVADLLALLGHHVDRRNATRALEAARIPGVVAPASRATRWTIPREALLDRYGSVAEDGTYSSSVASRSARFFTTLGALVKGRVCISGGAIAATRQALAIALTYAEERTQFPRAGGEGEVTLLDYRTHQRRLLPLLARTIALGFALMIVGLVVEHGETLQRDTRGLV